MDNKFSEINKFLENLSRIIDGFKTHPSFGSEGKFAWPYHYKDSVLIIRYYNEQVYSSTAQLINHFISEIAEIDEIDVELLDIQSDDSPLGLRLDEFTINPVSNKSDPDSMNMVKEVVNNKENLKIRDWPIGNVITSAIFNVVISNVIFVRGIFDRRKLANPSEVFNAHQYPTCFDYSVAWSNIFKLCVSPFAGPVLVAALTELSFLRESDIPDTLLIPSIESYELYIPPNKKYFKSGFLGFLFILNIDEQIALDLEEQVEKLNSIEPLKLFLDNLKLELSTKRKLRNEKFK